MNNSVKNKLLYVLGILFVLTLFVLMVVVLRQPSVEESVRVRISIRPADATPVTVTTDEGFLNTFVTSDFDIDYTKSMGSLVFSSLTHKTSEGQTPDSNTLVVVLEPKEKLSLQDEFFNTLSSDEVIDLNNGYFVKNIKVYEDRWILGLLVTTQAATDGESVVLERTASENIIIEAGTSLDVSSLIRAGVPSNIAEKIVEDSYRDL